MSALCQKRTLCSAANSGLFDHFVGSGDQAGHDSEAKRLGGLKVDSHRITRRPLNGQLSRLFTFKHAIDISRSSAKLLNEVDKLLLPRPRA
jgi:hypothetical protein